MHRIDSDGATEDNLFTEGNAGMAVPATIVSAAIMNALQEEVCEVIESAGITLLSSGTDTRNQLYSGILRLIERGGRPAPISMTPANNQSAAADVTGFPVFLTTAIRGIEFLFQAIRHTSSEDILQSGRVYLNWNANTSAWAVSKMAVGDGDDDDAIDVIEFSVLTTGNANEYKLQYKTSNMAGSSYSATLRITDIKYLLA